MARLTDAQLLIILQKAARRINRRLCLFGTDDEITVQQDGSILPQDGALEDLVLLQAECMITQRDYIEFLNSESSSAGTMVKDGEQTVDTRSAGSARASAFGSTLNPCSELENQIAQEKMDRLGGEGGPGKLIW